MTLNRPIVYIRGLSGSGKDILNLGPIPLPVHMTKPWVNFFRNQGVKVLAVEGLGRGLLTEQISNAEKYLEQNREELKDGFHLVGHSAGGLIGWALASHPEWKNKVLSLTTLATPHMGARLAESYIQSVETSVRLKLLDKLGYKIEPRVRMFRDLTREGMKVFKTKYRPDPTLPIASYRFSILPEEMTWPLRLAYSLGLKIPGTENDGFVELESQTEGICLGHYQLDHLSQIGYHFYLNSRQKTEKSKLFEEIGLGLLKHLEQIEQFR